jgi:hypothetical protein
LRATITSPALVSVSSRTRRATCVPGPISLDQ